MGETGLWGFPWTWKFWRWLLLVILLTLFGGLVILTHGGPAPDHPCLQNASVCF
jgi:hypothetical protein